MCGIAGVAYADEHRPADTHLLRRMTEAVRHRGPDSEGYFAAPGVGLGIRRLSIIDLATGDQPISNENGTVTVVCNGEIYNYVELRKQLIERGHRFRTGSDVEAVVHLYEEQGVGLLHQLRGMFGFALWDSRRRLLLLARDRLGIKPMHYSLASDALFFGSESKAILAVDGIPRQLNVPALRDLFTFGFVLGPKTLLSSVRRLNPGHYLLYRDGEASIHKYWDVSFPPRGEEGSSVNAERWAESLLEELEESVTIHLRSDVAVGAWLSGGIDSSFVARLSSRDGQRPLPTFTLAFENHRFDEVRGQRTLDQFPGNNLSNTRALCGDEHLKLIPKVVWHCEDPSVSAVQIPRMVMSELASRSVKVVMTGEGADELFGGYGWFRVEGFFRALACVPIRLRRLALLGGFLPGRWPHAAKKLVAPREMSLLRYQHLIARRHSELVESLLSCDLTRPLPPDNDTGPVEAPPENFKRWSPFAQLQYFEMKVRLPDFVIHHLDRTSMAHSLEARVPFLDHKLVEFCARIPASLKMRWGQEKYILRRAAEKVLPPEIANRKKRGLAAPVDQWMRGTLPDFATEYFQEDCLREKGYFNPGVVFRLLKMHRSGKGDYGDLLFGVLLVQIWDDLFVRNRKQVMSC
jgi:asparagine synthase (glutamine-hydrolysing)